jgi:hypothetical protein
MLDRFESIGLSVPQPLTLKLNRVLVLTMSLHMEVMRSVLGFCDRAWERRVEAKPSLFPLLLQLQLQERQQRNTYTGVERT